MALTIADAFKLAYENHEKRTVRGKPENDQGSSRVAQDDNKENTEHAKPVVDNGHVDTYARPATRKNNFDAPTIHVSADCSSSSTAVEDSSNKFQALVNKYV